MRQQQEKQRKEQQWRRGLNEAVLKTEQLIAQEQQQPPQQQQQQQQQQQMVVASDVPVVTNLSGDQSYTEPSVGDVKQKVLKMQRLIQDQAADKKPSSFPSKISISAAVFKCCPLMRITSE